MAQELATQRAPQSDDDERHDDRGENRVGRQNREIDWAHDSLAREPRRAVMRVIDDVGNQKQNRRRQRRDLATPVRQDSATTNEVVTGCQQNEAGSVERGVEMGKDGVEIN